VYEFKHLLTLSTLRELEVCSVPKPYRYRGYYDRRVGLQLWWKGKSPVLAAALLTRVRLETRRLHFSISEAAVDWHQLMMWASKSGSTRSRIASV